MSTQTMHTFGEELPIAMKIMNFALPAISGALTAAGLNIDFQYVALAAGSAMAGSLLFGYFRRERTFGAQAYKTAMATIGGLILGSFVVHWRDYTAPAVIAMAYCVSAMLVLIFLRTIVTLFEENARTITTTLIQRVFNLKLETKKDSHGHKRRTANANGVHVSQTPGSPPHITIDATARPDEFRVIEETVVDTKKEGE